ncbi:MAG: microcin ABC transporter ATP-binding protein [Roseovarius sp.]|nr:microcin ABC transporter ATP-binding protein [Roseovarius sp.]
MRSTRVWRGKDGETMVISVKDLSVALPEGADRPHAMTGITFDVAAGEVLCIVGESGSGKSVTANTIMNLLPPGLTPVSGTIEMGGRDLLKLSDAEKRQMRGSEVAMIFQEPMTALNPLMRIKDQIAEVFEAHGAFSKEEREAKALKLVEEVGLPDPPKILRAYPFQLSGGQRQRVMIAMALALEPKLLIADEPTTALDVTTQAQILKLVRNLQDKHGMAVLFITHDIGVVAEIADRVIVMRQGEIVEQGATADVIGAPQTDYTRRLINAVPSLIPPAPRDLSADKVTVSVTGLEKTFVTSGGFFTPKREVRAIDKVSFDLKRGETLGIVGESGSGKSTTGRCIARLMEPNAGEIRLGDLNWGALASRELRAQRNRVQMVFQDPYASLNPRSKIATILTEGAVAQGQDKQEALAYARELLETVGLDASSLDRYPHEFSGGQRQRIGIARALMMRPEILIADEAVSALDVSVQAQVLDLFQKLREMFNLSIIFITHDLCVAAQVCDRILVMHQGGVVEAGSTAEVFAAPSHDYTRSLLAAVPGWKDDSPLRRTRATV